jgi:hypothetical protein
MLETIQVESEHGAARADAEMLSLSRHELHQLARFFSVLGRDPALRSKLLTNVGGMAFAVKLRIGSASTRCVFAEKKVDNRKQIAAILQGTAPCGL